MPSAIRAELPEIARMPAVAAPHGWRIVRKLADGGTAHVFVVERDGEQAIWKLGRWRDRDVRSRFELEAEVLRAVGPPACPAYREHGVVDGWPYVIMENVPGDTLATWMSRNGERGALPEILAIVIAIAGTLDAVHANGYVHRDLKPENVMIGASGIRLLDFGLAKRLKSATPGLTKLGAVVGTAHYLAPEQIRTGAYVDHRADIYSFGIVMFEMLAGRPPFVGERRALEYQHQTSRAPRVSELRAVPSSLDELVLACMAKLPEARPQNVADIRARASQVMDGLFVKRNVVEPKPRPVGTELRVALVCVQGGDLVDAVRAIGGRGGTVVRDFGDGVVAAFTPAQHDDPAAVALGACHALASEQRRIVLHVAPALVRRSASGKIAVYGADIDQVARWIPSTPFSGLVLSRDAAQAIAGAQPASDLPGFFRDPNDTGEPRALRLFGRDRLVADALAAATERRHAVIAISGVAGSGKTRLLDAICERARTDREVVAIRGRRRFLGDRFDDERLIDALGGGTSVADALADAGARDVLVAIDDAHLFSPHVRAALVAKPARATCVVTTREPMFEAAHGDREHVAYMLEGLPIEASQMLVRELLQPAELLPDVLIERLAIRGAGNPGLLVALARDIKRRGAIRRDTAGNDWYVAVDELDTLLAPPGADWIAQRALAHLPSELVPIAHVCAALGPRFRAAEVAAAIDEHGYLPALVTEGMLVERAGWYEFADGELQQAIYDHAVDDRAHIHARVLTHVLAHRDASLLGWLARIAHHAAGAAHLELAVACWVELAHAAAARGEHDHVAELLSLARRSIAWPPEIAAAIDEH